MKDPKKQAQETREESLEREVIERFSFWKSYEYYDEVADIEGMMAYVDYLFVEYCLLMGEVNVNVDERCFGFVRLNNENPEITINFPDRLLPDCLNTADVCGETTRRVGGFGGCLLVIGFPRLFRDTDTERIIDVTVNTLNRDVTFKEVLRVCLDLLVMYYKYVRQGFE